MFSRLSIFHKMLIAPLLALVFFIAYMTYVYTQYLQSRHDFEMVRQEYFPVLQIADENLLLLENMKQSFQNAISANEPSWIQHAKNSKASIVKNLDHLQSFHSLLNPALLLNMKHSLEHFYELSVKMSHQLMQTDNMLKFDENFNQDFEKARHDSVTRFSNFKTSQIASFNAMIDHTNNKRKSVVIIGVFLGLFALVTIIIVTMLLSLRTKNSLNALLNSVRNMADENPDFSQRIQHKENDELGLLVKQFNRFTEKLERDHKELINAKKSLEKANTKLEKLSITDGLTGIYNRRYFDELLKRLWHTKMRANMPLSLIMIDIDYFKKFNDHYGHQKGDECLLMTVQNINSTLQRSTDTLCRYGGEEFCILIEGPSKEAEYIAQAISKTMAETNYEHIQSPFGKVTLSMGIATLAVQSTLDHHMLVKYADEALYVSKETGRNRYSISKV